MAASSRRVGVRSPTMMLTGSGEASTSWRMRALSLSRAPRMPSAPAAAYARARAIAAPIWSSPGCRNTSVRASMKNAASADSRASPMRALLRDLPEASVRGAAVLQIAPDRSRLDRQRDRLANVRVSALEVDGDRQLSRADDPAQIVSTANSTGMRSPSTNPWAAATDQLLVAIAFAPLMATALALPASQTLNSTSGAPLVCSARNASAVIASPTGVLPSTSRRTRRSRPRRTDRQW